MTVPTFQGYRRADGRVGVRNHVLVLSPTGLTSAAAQRARITRARNRLRDDRLWPRPGGCGREAALRYAARPRCASERRCDRGPVGGRRHHVVVRRRHRCNRQARCRLLAAGRERGRAYAGRCGRARRDAPGARCVAAAARTLRLEATVHRRRMRALGCHVGPRLQPARRTHDGVCRRRRRPGDVQRDRRVDRRRAPARATRGHARSRRSDRAGRGQIASAWCATAGGDIRGQNPGPQNKAGGLTTIEEKALGAIAKGGHQPIHGLLRAGAATDRRPVSS